MPGYRGRFLATILPAAALFAAACELTHLSTAPITPAAAQAARTGGRVTLFTGGFVVTEPGAEPKEMTISVADGRILRLGPDGDFAAERAAGANDFSVRGLTVVPGLTDSHGHLYQFGASLEKLTFVGADYSETLKRIEQAVVERRARGWENDHEWIEGRGWDQNLWPGQNFPTKADLDRLSPVNPIHLIRIDGHASWVNSAAMKKAGISRETQDPAGGKILRDASGEPTGVLIDRATELVGEVIPLPTRETVRRRLMHAMQKAAAAGLTEVHDAGVDPKEVAPLVLEALEELAATEDLPVRVYAMLASDADPKWLAAQYRLGPRKTGRDDRLRIRAVKFYLDGALGSRGAALLDDYADDPGNRGLELTDAKELRTRMGEASKAGFQLAVHAIGDRANRTALDIYEALLPSAGSDPRFRIEHAQIISPVDIPRFARLGVIAAMQPTHATSDMPWAPARLGPSRLAGAYAWKSLIRAGTHVSGGSDFPIEEIAPSHGIFAAVTRQDASEQPAGGWLPEERLTRNEALALYTTEAAWAAFEEKERGKIAPGFRADLTMFRGSPTVVEIGLLRNLPVAITVIGGQISFQH